MISSEMLTRKVFQLDQPMSGRFRPPVRVSSASFMSMNARSAAALRSLTRARFTVAVRPSAPNRIHLSHFSQVAKVTVRPSRTISSAYE